MKYETCLLHFEDRFFYFHPGINPFSLARAFYQNIKAKEIVSGGSTISMQVCRMARRQKPRTLKNKLIEMLWAVSLELRFSKNEIIKMYAAHAPFGGNTVGIDAASWRYFKRHSTELSWADAATLAVLPNAPALIYPGKKNEQLKIKRDNLLQKLLYRQLIDTLTFNLSIAEPLPLGINSLPNLAYHFTQKIATENRGMRFHSSIDYFLQQKVNNIVSEHHKLLSANHIQNLAVLVAEVPTKKICVYVGNVFSADSVSNGNHVDIIQSARSTGSILKPFLYCKMIDEGLLTPKMLVPDIPIRFGGFTPVNFDREYNGAVPADEALARSLNIPAVNMLRDYGVAPFYSFLKKAGMTSLSQNPDYYGLSLILGGAEISLFDLTGMYASLASVLKNYNENDGFYADNPFSPLIYSANEVVRLNNSAQPQIRAASVFCTLQALLEVQRPDSEAGWNTFANSPNIAWKTGTSFGFRDAWAIGVSPDYTVGVWVGNADGEGRSGLTGVGAAAPVLFDVFGILPQSDWFLPPTDELQEISVCANSGYLPGENCNEFFRLTIPAGTKVGLCPWHKKIHLDGKAEFRVNSDCYPVANMRHDNYFVLPPAIEYYFRQKNPFYRVLPPLMPACTETESNLEFIYPREWEKLFIPVELDGTPGKLVFHLACRQSEAEVFWYLNEKFLGTTRQIHQMALSPEKGRHTLTVTSNLGNSITRSFEVFGKE